MTAHREPFSHTTTRGVALLQAHQTLTLRNTMTANSGRR